MEHRLGRTLRVFLIVLAAAGFHRLTLVPLIERSADEAVALEPTAEESAAIKARAASRLAVLDEVFPEGAWERDDPVVLESREMRLLFKQYHSLPDGRVNLVPCTLVLLPKGGTGEPGRTTVLRAPQGAVLEFDEPLDLRKGRLAKLVGGSLRGEVTVRATPSTATAEDDIEIVTRDIEMENNRLTTGEVVRFRYGRSRGHGRGLTVGLLAAQTDSDQGPNIGGVDMIRLEQDVQMRLEGVAGGFLPGSEAARPAGREDSAEAPPVLVRCRGALEFSVSGRLVTLEDRVDVTRTLPGGGMEQLACDRLAILLSDEAAGGSDSFEPVEIEARGNPVVARGTADGLEARGQRLGYEIATRRILLDGEQPVMLKGRGTELEARSVDYVPSAGGGPGSLMAVGPGWLESAGGRGNPPARVVWRKWLRMRPDGEGHVASVAGDAEVVVEGQGRLAASEIHLWLDETDSPAPASAAASLEGVRPSRMLARGMVETLARSLTARTDRLEVWFRHPPPPQKPPASPPPGATAAAPPPAAPPPPPPAPPQKEPPPTRGRIVANAALVRGLVEVRPAGPQVAEISLEGGVQLTEEPLEAGDGPSLSISGDQAQVTRPASFDAKALVSGRPARIAGRGMELEGPLVEFDRGLNRVTVDGAGRMRLPAGGGAGFEALAVAPTKAEGPAAGQSSPPTASAAGDEPLEVVWQGRMDFDGLTARFIDRVVTHSGDSTLEAGSLDVVLDGPIDFSPAGGPSSDDRQVARVACGGGVRIRTVGQGDDGSRSVERLYTRDLVLDRVSGDVVGNGPGRLESVRLGQPPGMPAVPGESGGPQAAAPPRPDELNFLGIDFQRGLRGNIGRRILEFHQRVEAIFGPVASWEETLDPHDPRGLPPRAVRISTDTLGAGQSPPMPGRQRATLELYAQGNVLVEGESFTGRSSRLRWSEAKDLIVFEGDGRTDAQLYRQMKVGAPTSTASAGKILFWRSLDRIDIHDARYLDLDQINASATGLRPPGS